MNRFNSLKGLAILAALSLGLSGITNSDALANSGGWGGTTNSYGSTGSFSCCGGSSGGAQRVYRTPVRNLLGRVGYRISNIGHHSSGGSCGGFYRAPMGMWGTGNYGCCGGWDAAAGSLSMMTPYGTTMPGSVGPNSIMEQPPVNSPRIPDGGSINSMLDTPGPAVQPQPASSIRPIGGDATSSDRPAVGASVLNVQLPQDAKVFINDQLTKTEGSTRSYRSTNLEFGKEHRYSVKAVINRNGIETIKTKLVKLIPGEDETIRFDFDSHAPLKTTIATTLRLEVPADAIVTLCGSQTQKSGKLRTFTTNRLPSGETWKDYKIQVQFERDGKTMTQEKTVDLFAGKSHSFTFLGDDSLTSQFVKN
ncbi:TIGR03000 domain-containing protein [Mariniblastus sp.]|nr:TIGR03000 domain-containing protein [Mariniblastus sp.]MDA7923762.1 TIGR03000 domain-containing protein [Mariniblastus sp.]MDC3223803.1 TIGR03000 domain-containing protein [Mariniblastus sp.]